MSTPSSCPNPNFSLLSDVRGYLDDHRVAFNELKDGKTRQQMIDQAMIDAGVPDEDQKRLHALYSTPNSMSADDKAWITTTLQTITTQIQRSLSAR